MSLLDYISLMRFEVLAVLLLLSILVLRVIQGSNAQGNNLVSAIVLILMTCIGFMGIQEGSAFGGMFILNKTVILQKQLLSFATLLILAQSQRWLKQHPSSSEFLMLLVSVLSGMFFMISAGNFLMFYLGLELATLPLATLVAFDHMRTRSAEGAGKMILSSAFSSAILLFGLSLIYGVSGSLDFSIVTESISAAFLPLLGISFFLVGFAFKIAAVPFHLWTADTYEGAPVPVTTFLSVVSKAAAFFAFVNVLYKVFAVAFDHWQPVIMLLSAVTMTVGNLFAMRQSNLKRFLAFSSITQAGYLLMGVAAGTVSGYASVYYFLLIYVFSNVAAFTVVSMVQDKDGDDDISSLRGLYASNPALSIVMLIALLSLAGVPPTAGFFGKLFLLTSGASQGLIWLLIIASLNMVISLYYYLRFIKVMFVDQTEGDAEKINWLVQEKVLLVVCVLGILIIGFLPQIYNFIVSNSFRL